MNNTFKPSFKANLLKTIANKKDNKGFTLIELLVVVIIIGVLAAIALPNLLGQVGKARESEAKSTLGAMNRAQQSFFTERTRFAADSDELEVPVGNEKYYTITVENGTGIQNAIGDDNPQAGTRDYEAGVQYYQTDRTFNTIVCRSTTGPAFTDSAVSGAGSVNAATNLICSGGEAVQ